MNSHSSMNFEENGSKFNRENISPSMKTSEELNTSQPRKSKFILTTVSTSSSEEEDEGKHVESEKNSGQGKSEKKHILDTWKNNKLSDSNFVDMQHQISESMNRSFDENKDIHAMNNKNGKTEDSQHSPSEILDNEIVRDLAPLGGVDVEKSFTLENIDERKETSKPKIRNTLGKDLLKRRKSYERVESPAPLTDMNNMETTSHQYNTMKSGRHSRIGRQYSVKRSQDEKHTNPNKSNLVYKPQIFKPKREIICKQPNYPSKSKYTKLAPHHRSNSDFVKATSPSSLSPSSYNIHQQNTEVAKELSFEANASPTLEAEFIDVPRLSSRVIPGNFINDDQEYHQDIISPQEVKVEMYSSIKPSPTFSKLNIDVTSNLESKSKFMPFDEKVEIVLEMRKLVSEIVQSSMTHSSMAIVKSLTLQKSIQTDRSIVDQSNNCIIIQEEAPPYTSLRNVSCNLYIDSRLVYVDTDVKIVARRDSNNYFAHVGFNSHVPKEVFHSEEKSPRNNVFYEMILNHEIGIGIKKPLNIERSETWHFISQASDSWRNNILIPSNNKISPYSPVERNRRGSDELSFVTPGSTYSPEEYPIPQNNRSCCTFL